MTTFAFHPTVNMNLMRKDNMIGDFINTIPLDLRPLAYVFSDYLNHLRKSRILVHHTLFMTENANFHVGDTGHGVLRNRLMTELAFYIELLDMLVVIKFNRLLKTTITPGKNYNQDDNQ